jgi:hypothetical protein
MSGGFRATYGEHAARMLSSEAPGCAPPRFWLPVYERMYAHVGHQLFPWNDIDDWAPRAGKKPRLFSPFDTNPK